LTDQSRPISPRRSTRTVAVVLALIAGWQTYRGHDLVAIVAGTAAVALIACSFSEAGARWFHARWMKLAHALGYVNSRIILTAVYFVVITPIGALRRMLGRDPLDRRTGARASYWTARKSTRQERVQFERAF
jgi:hypothetical protein